MATTETESKPAQAKAQATEYVILEQQAGSMSKQGETVTVNMAQGGLWREVARKTARSADEAIRQHAGENAGTYIAVPARSWQPRTVKVETKKIVHLA